MSPHMPVANKLVVKISKFVGLLLLWLEPPQLEIKAAISLHPILCAFTASQLLFTLLTACITIIFQLRTVQADHYPGTIEF
jgi:hypothetical protein